MQGLSLLCRDHLKLSEYIDITLLCQYIKDNPFPKVLFIITYCNFNANRQLLY